MRSTIASSSSSTPTPVLPLHGSTSSGIDAQHRLHLLHDFFRPGVLQVDLVEHRHDRQVVLHGRVGVGHGLGLDPLKGVDQQQRPFAARQAARNFVMKIDVPRRIDQVQLVLLAVVARSASPRRGL